jgi:hypothetical protein
MVQEKSFFFRQTFLSVFVISPFLCLYLNLLSMVPGLPSKEMPFIALMRIFGQFRRMPEKPANVSTASEKLPYLTHMKPNREKIEAEELVKERLPLTKWELTPKEKEDFVSVMRLMFDAASILRYDLELGQDASGFIFKGIQS